MEFRIGPVPASSARWWAGYARDVLANVVSEPGTLADVDDSMLVAFGEFLDEWEQLAINTNGGDFTWSMELDAGQVLTLVEAFHELVVGLSDAAEQRGYALAPPEGEEFYRSLVEGLLDGLVETGGTAGERGAELRAAWPGLVSN